MEGVFQLRLLGPVQVERDGEPVGGFESRKALALLGYLAVTGRTHSREALASLFWGETTDANARASLRKLLADLRHEVAPHLIVTRQEIAFDRESPYWLDVEAFERRVRCALERREGALTAEGAVALAEATELYRGDFLDGFHVRQAPAFEEWVLLKRERLRLSALRALHTLAAHHAAQGAYTQAIE